MKSNNGVPPIKAVFKFLHFEAVMNIPAKRKTWYFKWKRPMIVSAMAADGILSLEPEFFFEFSSVGKKDSKGRHIYVLTQIVKK